jgi:hypothetical protein
MIQKIVVLIVLSSFFISCQCDKYYSDSDKKTTEGKLGDIKCEIVPNVISTDSDHMAIYFDFKETMKNKIDWESLEVYPILNKDTLKIDPNYSDGGYYKYDSNKYRNSKLDLSIKYKLEGYFVVKEEVFKGLEKKKVCRWRFALH